MLLKYSCQGCGGPQPTIARWLSTVGTPPECPPAQHNFVAQRNFVAYHRNFVAQRHFVAEFGPKKCIKNNIPLFLQPPLSLNY